MDELLINDIEVASGYVVRQAARDFAVVLYESEPFQAFVVAAKRLENDSVAQKAIRAFQEKQQSLQMMFRLNAVSVEDRAELDKLHKQMLAEASVIEYVNAQSSLIAVCQQLADRLSKWINLDYATSCGASCCG